jgi:hypothetical protein
MILVVLEQFSSQLHPDTGTSKHPLLYHLFTSLDGCKSARIIANFSTTNPKKHIFNLEKKNRHTVNHKVNSSVCPVMLAPDVESRQTPLTIRVERERERERKIRNLT